MPWSEVFSQTNKEHNGCTLETVDAEGKVVQVLEAQTENVNISFESIKAIFEHPQLLPSGDKIQDASLQYIIVFRKYQDEEVIEVPFKVEANPDRTVFTITPDEELILSEDYSIAIRTIAKGYGKSNIFTGFKFTTSEWDAFQAGGFGAKDYTQISDMLVDEAGSIYITGYFRGQTHFGDQTLYSKAKYASFLVKYDRSGQCLWARMVQGSRYLDYAQGEAIAFDREGAVYLVGRFNGTVYLDESQGEVFLTSDGRYNVFIAKYDDKGHFIWGKEAGGMDLDFGYDVAVDHHQNVYFSGSFSKKARFGHTYVQAKGGYDTFLVKYKSNGKLMWVRTSSGNGFEDSSRARSLAIDAQGNVYMAGVFRGDLNFGSDRLKSRGSFDTYVTKYTPSGTVVWTYAVGGYGWDYVYDMSVKGDYLYLTGSFTGQAKFGDEVLSSMGDSDIFLLKMTTEDPDISWVQRAEGTSWDKSLSVVLDDAHNIYITGSFYHTLDFGHRKKVYSRGASDIFVAKYNTEGEVLWAKSTGSKYHNDQGRALCRWNEDLYVAGVFNGSVRFGMVMIRSYGNNNLFVWRIKDQEKT